MDLQPFNDTFDIQDDDYTVTYIHNNSGTITVPSAGTPAPLAGPGANQIQLDSTNPHMFAIDAEYGLDTLTVVPGPGVQNPAAIDPAVLHYEYTFTATDTTVDSDQVLTAVFKHAIDVTISTDGAGDLELTSDSTPGPVGSDLIAGGTAVYDESNPNVLEILDSGSTNDFYVNLDGEPSNTHCVQDFIVDGVSQGLYTRDYSFTPLLENHTVDVTLTRKPTLTVNIEPAGTALDDPIGVEDIAVWKVYEADQNGIVLAELPGTSGLVLRSGDSVDIPCGIYYVKVVYEDLVGWATPVPELFNLNKDNYGDISTTGTYTPLQFKVRLVTSGNGTGEISVDPEGTFEAGSDYHVYSAGETVEFTVSPDSGSNFESWQQDLASYGNTSIVSLIIDQDLVAEARFVLPCVDNDGDGFIAAPAGGSLCAEPEPYDCNDFNNIIFPGADEYCGDGVNSNCGWVRDTTATIGFSPANDAAEESCGAGDLDQDGDGFTPRQGDCFDTGTPFWAEDSGGNNIRLVYPADVHPGAYDDCETVNVDEDCYSFGSAGGWDTDDGLWESGAMWDHEAGNRSCGAEITCAATVSDQPMNSVVQPAPPSIMFLLDDSGSMDWETIVPGENQGQFLGYIDYLFSGSGTSSLDTSSERRLWKAQWSGHNKMYYNPSSTYTPWARWHHDAMDNERYSGGTDLLSTSAYVEDADGYLHADPDSPRSDPMDKDYHLDLSGQYLNLAGDYDIEDMQRIVVTRRNNADRGSSTVADAVAIDVLNTKDPGHQGATHDASGFFEDNRCAWNHPDWWDGNSHDGNICSTYWPDYIFDNDGDNFTTTAGWSASSLDDWEWNGSADYTGTDWRSATWVLDIPASDDYYVYAWADDYNNRDRAARYRVYYDHDDNPGTALQTQDFYFNQVEHARHWHILDKLTSVHFSEQDLTANVINNSHYYVWNDNDGDDVQDNDEIYLVNLSGNVSDGTIDRQYYHVVDDNNNDRADADEVTLLDITVTDTSDPLYVPEGVRAKKDDGTYMTAEEERRNFANWYSFYRKREYTAKAAVGQTIEDMSGANIGFNTIWNRVVQPQVPVDLMGSDGVVRDQTELLLSRLYGVGASNGTPLRRGLASIGEYYRTGILSGSYNCQSDTSDDDTEICSTGSGYEIISPWATAGDGGSCQKAFVIAMTDGYWNSTAPSGAMNGDHDTSETNTDYDGGIFRDDTGHTWETSLADIAMYYYEHDLNTSLDDDVPNRGYDIANHQHMTTFGVAFGVTGSIDPRSFPDCLPEGEYDEDDPRPYRAVKNGTYEYDDGDDIRLDELPKYETEAGVLIEPTWVDLEGDATDYPVYRDYCPEWEGDDDKVDDLYHASINGRGKFLNAGDPDELILVMREIRKLIASQVTTAASLATNDIWLDSDTLIFQVAYQKKQWAGNVFAYCLNDNGYISSCDGTADGTTIKWNANDVAVSLGDDWWNTTRQVITYDDVNNVGIPFRYSSLNSDQQSALVSADIVNYIRGQRTNEEQNGGTLRDRLTYFGDMVNSTPVNYAGVLFAGANDGGLHAFDSQTGEELFTYIPALVYRDYIDDTTPPEWNNKLYQYTQIGYESIHKFFVDNSVDLQYIDTTATYLVGSLRKGGRGIYALNAKGIKDMDAESRAADIVAWEYPTAGHDLLDNDGDGTVDETGEAYDASSFATHTDPYMGYSFSIPQIAKVRYGAGYKWVVIFGNGYESYNKVAALYVVDLETGALLRRIIADGPARPTTVDACNGLSMPALLDTNLDKVIDWAYAGDLLGNMWKFDFTSTNPDDWDVYYEDSAGNPKPLFQAKNKQGYRQPITMKPVITKPCVYSGKGRMILFGTGRFVGEADLDDVSIQTLYGIWDWGAEWEAVYEEKGYSNYQDLAKQAYLGSFQTLLTDAEATACLTTCSNECEDSSNVVCEIFESECNDDCDADEVACDDTCAADETTCLDTCTDDLDTCNNTCASTYDPVTQAVELLACQDACVVDKTTCDTSCNDDRTTCEGVCDSDRTNCGSACATEESLCESLVTSDYCADAAISADIGTCNDDCTTTYTTCLVAAGGNADAQKKCADDKLLCETSCESFWSCTNYCGSDGRSLSNLPDIPHFTTTTKAKYVTLVEQTQLWAGSVTFYEAGEKVVNGEDYAGRVKEILYNPDSLSEDSLYVRVLSQNEPTWFDFEEFIDNQISYPNETVHVGWYYDLTITGERQVSNFLLNAGVVILNSIIPSRSPCSSGGYTYGQALDYCSGGAIESTYIDANGDLVIDEYDMIDIGTAGNPLLVPITGILNQGIRSAPAIIATKDGKGVLFNPGDMSGGGDGDDTGTVDSDDVSKVGVPPDENEVVPPGYGIYFWREVQ